MHVLAKRVKWSFYTKSVPISRSLETMSQVCFSETRFFNEHFTLFRRSHPGPTKPCFSGPKLVWKRAPLDPTIYTSLKFSHSPSLFKNDYSSRCIQTLDTRVSSSSFFSLNHQDQPLNPRSILIIIFLSSLALV